MNTLHSLASLLVLSLLTGCMSSAIPTVDNALLAELPPATLTDVVEARATRDSAEDTLAAAGRSMRMAEEQVELARSGLTVTRAGLDDAKLQVVVAKRSGTGSLLEATTKALTIAMSQADEARGLLALRKRELEQMRLTEKVAAEQVRLTRAQVELEKAEAVQILDQLEAKKIPLNDYRKQVRYHEVEAAFAKARLVAATSKTEEARDEHKALVAKVLELATVRLP